MGVARFSFGDLCEQPLAAIDYLRIAHEFHTVILEHIPVMDYARRNEATLLEAAAAAFVESGVDVPVRDIAARAGVGVGTVYRATRTRPVASFGASRGCSTSQPPCPGRC